MAPAPKGTWFLGNICWMDWLKTRAKNLHLSFGGLREFFLNFMHFLIKSGFSSFQEMLPITRGKLHLLKPVSGAHLFT